MKERKKITDTFFDSVDMMDKQICEIKMNAYVETLLSYLQCQGFILSPYISEDGRLDDQPDIYLHDAIIGDEIIVSITSTPEEDSFKTRETLNLFNTYDDPVDIEVRRQQRFDTLMFIVYTSAVHGIALTTLPVEVKRDNEIVVCYIPCFHIPEVKLSMACISTSEEDELVDMSEIWNEDNRPPRIIRYLSSLLEEYLDELPVFSEEELILDDEAFQELEKNGAMKIIKTGEYKNKLN